MGWPKGRPRNPSKPIAKDEAAEDTAAVTETPDIGGAEGSENDKRVEMLNAMADAIDPPDENDPADEQPAEPEATEAPAPQEATPAEPTKKYKLKVSGREFEVTEEELIARAQKNEAADQALADAKARREEAERILAEAKKNAVAPAQPATVEEDDRLLARKLQNGTEEEAAQAIQRLRPKSPSKDEIERLVSERLASELHRQEQKRLMGQALDEVKKQFPVFTAVPTLLNALAAEDAALLEQGDRRPYLERYTAIASNLMSKIAPAPAASEKLQRKATVTPITAASARAAAPVAQEPDEDPEKIVAEMARARGRNQ